MPGKRLRPSRGGAAAALIVSIVCAGAAPQAPGSARLSSLPVADSAAIGTRTNGRIFATVPGRGPYGVTSYSYPHGRRLFSSYFGLAAATFLHSLP